MLDALAAVAALRVRHRPPGSLASHRGSWLCPAGAIARLMPAPVAGRARAMISRRSFSALMMRVRLGASTQARSAASLASSGLSSPSTRITRHCCSVTSRAARIGRNRAINASRALRRRSARHGACHAAAACLLAGRDVSALAAHIAGSHFMRQFDPTTRCRRHSCHRIICDSSVSGTCRISMPEPGYFLCVALSSVRPIALKLLVCAAIAASAGSRSMLEAP